MARRGRCHCGHILQFQHGPHGFKVRCPQCGSVVRLGPEGRRKPPSSPSAPQLPAYDSNTPLMIASPETFPALPAAAPEAAKKVVPPPLPVVEIAPAPPGPPKFWTWRLLLVTLGTGLAALVVAALIGWIVWMAASES